MNITDKAIELRDMYLRWMDNLGCKNWEDLCKGENLSSYDEQKKWLTEGIESCYRTLDERETRWLEEQLEIELDRDERFLGFNSDLCHDIALAFRSIDWREEYKLQVLDEQVEFYNREYDNDEDMITLKEYVRVESENDPNFFFFLFDANEALVDPEDGHPTELGEEIFKDFLERL